MCIRDSYNTSAFFKKLKRASDFAIFGWSNFDFDSGYLYRLMLFKIQRIEKALKNGYAEHDKQTLQSIRICVKLLKKITAEDYNYFAETHLRKWGMIETDGDASNFSINCSINARRNSFSPEEKKQEIKEFLEAFEKDEAQHQGDINLLFAIMAKHSRSWWD